MSQAFVEMPSHRCHPGFPFKTRATVGVTGGRRCDSDGIGVMIGVGHRAA